VEKVKKAKRARKAKKVAKIKNQKKPNKNTAGPFRIRKLSPEVVKKIAAGQVIENAACVVKELLENSLDAGAENIIIEYFDEDSTCIKVIDDGCGMSFADLEECYLSHTTSKLSALEDITSIATLGFRGEALSSICAVASVRIRSRCALEDYGRELEISSSKLKSTRDLGMPVGTLIEVSELFADVPARKKFVESEKDVFSNILNSVLAYSIGNSEVRFKLSRNGKLILNHSLATDLFGRMIELFGNSAEESLVKVNHSLDSIESADSPSYSFGAGVSDMAVVDGSLTIYGYISRPEFSPEKNAAQLLFVNGRHVVNNKISRVLKNTYGTLLSSLALPAYALFLVIPPELLDVNVHPRKEHVAFWNEQALLDFVRTAIEKTLKEHDLTYGVNESAGAIEASSDYIREAISPYLYDSLKTTVKVWHPIENNQQYIQILDTFIAAPTKKGLLLIDQHAAHESVLFDQYLHLLTSDSVESANHILDPPITLNLSVPLYALALDSLDTFQNLGFDVEDFGKKSLRIRAIPAIFKGHDIPVLFEDLLADIQSLGALKSLDDRARRTISLLACKSAIKSGQKLSEDEMQKIVEKLGESSSYYTCPHGRPASIIISPKELEKLFKRRK
jgi:DNA mismatch repair protein MutL